MDQLDMTLRENQRYSWPLHGKLKKEPRTVEDILEQSIWINKDITINNKCISWKSWKKAGILYINDIKN